MTFLIPFFLLPSQLSQRVISVSRCTEAHAKVVGKPFCCTKRMELFIVELSTK